MRVTFRLLRWVEGGRMILIFDGELDLKVECNSTVELSWM